MKESENQSIIKYGKIVIEKKKPIIIVAVITLLLSSVLFFFIIEPVFYSSGTVKTASSGVDLGGLLGGAGIPDIGELGDIAGSSSVAKELAYYETILTSRRCLEEIILQFNLMEENKYKFMQDAVKDFRENTLIITKDRVAGTMEIGVFDKEPQRAKNIADYLINQLNLIYTELSIKNAKNNREFIESRYQIVKNDLKIVEDSLTIFQNRYGISPDIQIQAGVRAEIELESELIAEELKLEILNTIVSQDQPEIKLQKEKISVLKEQVEKLRSSSFEDSKLYLKGSPDIIMNFFRLKREVEIQNRVLTTLIPLLEKAKIDENNFTPTVLILDQPVIPERKAKPKRVINILILTFTMTLFSSLYFVFKQKWLIFKKEWA